MISLDIHYEDGQFLTESRPLPLLVGRGAECGLRLMHWRIAKNHFLLRRGVDGVYIEDLGSLMGTRVNGRRITRFGPLKQTDTCIAGPCKLHIAETILVNKLNEPSILSATNAQLIYPRVNDQSDSNIECRNNQFECNEGRVAQDMAGCLDIRRALHASLIQALDWDQVFHYSCHRHA